MKFENVLRSHRAALSTVQIASRNTYLSFLNGPFVDLPLRPLMILVSNVSVLPVRPLQSILHRPRSCEKMGEVGRCQLIKLENTHIRYGNKGHL